MEKCTLLCTAHCARGVHLKRNNWHNKLLQVLIYWLYELYYEIKLALAVFLYAITSFTHVGLLVISSVQRSSLDRKTAMNSGLRVCYNNLPRNKTRLCYRTVMRFRRVLESACSFLRLNCQTPHPYAFIIK